MTRRPPRHRPPWWPDNEQWPPSNWDSARWRGWRHGSSRRQRRPFGCLFIIPILLIAGLLTSAVWALAALVGALNRFYFPSRYALDRDGITAHHPLRTESLRWRELRRFEAAPYGGYLSASKHASRLEPPWRGRPGMQILFGREREAVVAAIRACLPQEPV